MPDTIGRMNLNLKTFVTFCFVMDLIFNQKVDKHVHGYKCGYRKIIDALSDNILLITDMDKNSLLPPASTTSLKITSEHKQGRFQITTYENFPIKPPLQTKEEK